MDIQKFLCNLSLLHFISMNLLVASVVGNPLRLVRERRSTESDLRVLERKTRALQQYHERVYNSLRIHRFGDSRLILPEMNINGLVQIDNFMQMHVDPEVLEVSSTVELLRDHYLFVHIYKHAMDDIWTREDTIKAENEDLIVPKFHTYEETHSVIQDIKSLRTAIGNLIETLTGHNHHIEETSYDFTSSSQIHGQTCDETCKDLRYLYIHQHFQYYLEQFARQHFLKLKEREIDQEY